MSKNIIDNPFARRPKIVDSQDTSESFDPDLLGFVNQIPHSDLNIPPPPLPPKTKTHNTRSKSKPDDAILTPFSSKLTEKPTDTSTQDIPKNTTEQTSPIHGSVENIDITPESTNSSSTNDTTESCIPLINSHTSNIIISSDSESDLFSSNSKPSSPIMSSLSLIVPMLPEYGEDEDIQYFIERCERLEKILTVPEEKIMLASFIAVKLKGQAQKAVSVAKAVTWTEIKTALSTLNKPSRPVEDIQAEIAARTQRSGESVAQFGEAHATLFNELSKSYKKEMTDGTEELSPSMIVILQRQAVRNFETGLKNDQLRMMVIMNKSKTIRDAISCALAFESRLPKKAVTTGTANGSSTSSSTPISKTTCETCKKSGHTSQTCYRNKIKSEPKTEPTVTVRCNYCKENGHTITDCEIRKENNRRAHGDENYRPPPRIVNHLQAVPNQASTPNPSTSQNQSGNEQPRVVINENPARLEDLPN